MSHYALREIYPPWDMGGPSLTTQPNPIKIRSQPNKVHNKKQRHNNNNNNKDYIWHNNMAKPINIS